MLSITVNYISAQKIDVIDASFSVFVFCDDSAYFLKQRRSEDLRVHISEQAFAVTVDACVFFIAEYIIDGVFAERFIMVSDPFRIEIGDNVSDNDAFGAFAVNVTDDFCLIFVDDDFFCRPVYNRRAGSRPENILSIVFPASRALSFGKALRSSIGSCPPKDFQE